MKVGVCPACCEIVAIKKKALFFVCEDCGKTVPTREALAYLDSMCADPAGVNNNIDLILKLHEEGNVDVALAVAEKLRQHFPNNELVNLTYVRASGYDPVAVQKYLETFAAVAGVKPYAEEFLEKILEPHNMTLITLLNKFIENKLPPARQKQWKDKLDAVRTEYLGQKTGSGNGLMLLYAFYIGGIVLNLVAAVIMIVLHMMFIINIAITLAIFAVEIFLFFLHNKTFGNRLGMSARERAVLAVFMSSIPLVIAGLVIGGIL